jgi:hypothetical protein
MQNGSRGLLKPPTCGVNLPCKACFSAEYPEGHPSLLDYQKTDEQCQRVFANPEDYPDLVIVKGVITAREPAGKCYVRALADNAPLS